MTTGTGSGGTRSRFDGTIAGVGTASGTRLVVGMWRTSPLGAFTDVMVERPDGRRILLAPAATVAEFVAATYVFDDVRVADIVVTGTPGDRAWTVDAGPLRLTVEVGRRTVVGRLLRLVPAPIATSTSWAATLDPIARLVLRGVRTRGGVGDRREWYAARDQHRIERIHATWNGDDLGGLADVAPPVRFGFGSTPRAPSVVRLVTTVETPQT